VKLTKALVITLVVGLLVVYYFLGTGYAEKHRQQAALTSQIAEAARQLAQIPPAPPDLEPRLAAAGDALEQAKNAFPAPPDSILIVRAVLRLADETGVKAVPLIMQPWSMENVNKVDYPVFRLNISARGTFTRLTDFINRLENGEPETLVITDLNLDRTTDPPAAGGETGDEITIEASLNIAVYARPQVTEPSPEVAE
jgi:hypothetical protein